jgi:hypothetical protein
MREHARMAQRNFGYALRDQAIGRVHGGALIRPDPPAAQARSSGCSA